MLSRNCCGVVALPHIVVPNHYGVNGVWSRIIDIVGQGNENSLFS
jgi:hypothetical protein